MRKYIAEVEDDNVCTAPSSTIVLKVNGEFYRPREEHEKNACKINAIFRAHEEREKREKECEESGGHYNGIGSESGYEEVDFCLGCGKDMRGEA